MAATSEYKVFNDPIHGLVKLHPLLVKIMDTPQFQRFRNIKQLGVTSYVYPGATHSRFEHSIGVAYLAGELVQGLMEIQKEERTKNDEENQQKERTKNDKEKEKEKELERITNADKLCVQIAGLCHDLGHGPFSHQYEEIFKPKEEPKDQKDENKPKSWTHEMASIEMFDHLVKVNELEEDMTKAGLDLPKDLDFIKELIIPEHYNQRGQWPFHGRPEDKSFLYEIVANKRNGIDVDKWDYFARDCHYLGIKNSFDYQRLILSARVCKVEGRNEICFRDKEVFNLYDMFYTRFSLHKRACQHKVARAVGLMITDAFVKAKEHIQIRGSGGNIFNLDTAKDDMEAYTKLTDDVFEQILNHPNPNNSDDLEEAKDLLARIHRRKLYECVFEFQTEDVEITKEAIRAQLPEEYQQEEHFLIDIIELNYGMGKEDPIQHVRFYRKKEPEKPIQFTREEKQNEEIQEPPIKRINLTREVSHLLPETFAEKTIRIYYKGTKAEILKAAKDYFEGVHFKEKFQQFLK